jgi:GcrA cell cycle regulator
MTEWTAERIEEMTFLWSEGVNATDIAAKLGGVSRNAVLGKLHRLKLRDRVDAAKASTPKLAVVKAPKAVVVKPAPAPVHAGPALIGSVLRPEPLLKTLLDLNNGECRWPVDGERAETRFCCHAVSQGSSYCEYHRLASKGSGTVSERLAARELRRAA